MTVRRQRVNVREQIVGESKEMAEQRLTQMVLEVRQPGSTTYADRQRWRSDFDRLTGLLAKLPAQPKSERMHLRGGGPLDQ